MKPTIIIVVILILAVSHLSTYYLGRSHAEIKYRTQIDTLIVYKTVKDSSGYKPKIIKVKESANIDSLFEVAKKYWQDKVVPDTVYPSINYVASLDTTYENDLLKAEIDFVSRIPLDPEAYYRLNFDVKKETIFVPTYKKEERDTWGVGFGILGHFQDSVKVNLFGNISYKIMNFKYFEMPITAEIEFGDNLNIIDKKLRIEGKFKF